MDKNVNISHCMKRNVICITMETKLRDAAMRLVEHHVGMLPIIDEENRVVGMLGLADILELLLPDFVHLLDNLDFVHDFGALEDVRVDAEMGSRLVSEIMRKPVTVKEDAGLLRAYTKMLKHNLHDLPIVKPDGTLVGIASRVDIGTAILSRKETGGFNSSEITGDES